MSNIYFGIDLGTTNTVVSMGSLTSDGVIKSEKIKILQFDEDKSLVKDFTLPSMIYVDKYNEEFVGKIAKSIKCKNSKKVLSNTKRYIGTNQTWRLGNKIFTAKDVSKIILKTCKESMKIYNNGNEVEKVTITVPASFNTDQIKDTKDAAMEIGFKEVNLIPEPTAGLIDFINEQSNLKKHQRIINLEKKSRIMVFDLGGGTCDVAVVDVFTEGRKLDFSEVAIGRYDEVGGIDFDNKVATYKLNEFLIENNIDYNDLEDIEKEGMIRSLRIFSEKAKEHISKCLENSSYFGEKFNYIIENFYKNNTYNFSIDKYEYDYIIKDFFINSVDIYKRDDEESKKNIVDPIINTLNDYKISKEGIDYLYLVGGMTKYPTIKDEIRKILNISEDKIIIPSDPLGCVSKGASIYDYYDTKINRVDKDTEKYNNNFNLKRVLAESIMIDVKEGLPVTIINANQEVPYKGELKGALKTTSPSGVEINLYAGKDRFDSKMRIQRKYKAYFKRPKKPNTPIDIEFSIDKDKYLKIYIDVLGEKIELKQEVDLKDLGGI